MLAHPPTLPVTDQRLRFTRYHKLADSRLNKAPARHSRVRRARPYLIPPPIEPIPEPLPITGFLGWLTRRHPAIKLTHAQAVHVADYLTSREDGLRATTAPGDPLTLQLLADYEQHPIW